MKFTASCTLCYKWNDYEKSEQELQVACGTCIDEVYLVVLHCEACDRI